MLISKGSFASQSLAGKVATVTGAGGGIGYEAARALLWLGAKVVIAEINKSIGKQADVSLNREFGIGSALFVHTDVGDERSVIKLRDKSIQAFGKVDILINNATVAPLGAVKDLGIEDWDASYRVNLRAPALLAKVFVPDMVSRGYGVFMCVSSLGQEFMAAYESMKAAQVHLGSTLAAELDGTGVFAFTVGPGYVPTRTAEESIPKMAAMMNKPVDELFAIVKQYELSIEAAGAGFAAAVVNAEKYVGQEISSTQALMDAGIEIPTQQKTESTLELEDFDGALEICRRVHVTLKEQSAGWKERSVFEYQWMVRSFKKQAGMPVEKWLDALRLLEKTLEARDANGVSQIEIPLHLLADFYSNMYEMAKGYVKDQKQRDEQLSIVQGWREDVERLRMIIKH